MAEPQTSSPGPEANRLCIAGRSYGSRLLAGTGKYRDADEAQRAILASGAEIVTVAIRRSNLGQHDDGPNLLERFPPPHYTVLPNTAGCFDCDSAVRVCRLARELVGHGLVKLEVLGDREHLFPDTEQTLRAARILIREDFSVMAYTSDDPITARHLEQEGCVAVMPLAAPIGSGLGIQNAYNIAAIVAAARVPILVDAGVGTASDAAQAMELGCDGVLMNTAIARAREPERMALAMRLAVQAGREAFLAGRIPRRTLAQPSSSMDGRIGVPEAS